MKSLSQEVRIFLLLSALLYPVTSCVLCHRRALASAMGMSKAGSPTIMFDAREEFRWSRHNPPELGTAIFSAEDLQKEEISNEDDGDSSRTIDGDENVLSTSMIASIGFYKNVISPLLPPACRFVPTCSQYGVQAIKEFGPVKGFILTGWRILRCSPFGGKGYDPPRWPPCSYLGTGDQP